MDLNEEIELFKQGYLAVGGLDEVGRGPLAGPVVAACVVVEPGFEIKNELCLVNDSKKLTEKKRTLLAELIRKELPGVGLGICDQETIDRIDILQASFLAMKKAIGSLKVKPGCILLDGKLPIPNFSLPQKPIIKGDTFVFSIAAASIIAKVFRDNLMFEMHEKYPDYRFDLHKGYGTKVHLEKLREYGPCPIHRKSFRPVKLCFDKFKSQNSKVKSAT